MFNKAEYDNAYHKRVYDRLAITVPKGTRDKLKAYCAARGVSVNGLINDYIRSLGIRAEQEQEQE